MATRILMPKLGLTMTEGTITEWVVNSGDKVTEGTVVMLIETDKVEAEVEAEADGIVTHTANVGETLEPGEPVGWLLGEGEQAPDGTIVEAIEEDTQETPSEIQEEILSEEEPTVETQQEVIAEEISNNEDETIQNSRLLASPNAKRIAKELDVDITTISGTGPGGRITSDDVQSLTPTKESKPDKTGRLKASPNAKRVAHEKGIDLSTISGTGPGGRITSEDVLAAPPVEMTPQIDPTTPVEDVPEEP